MTRRNEDFLFWDCMMMLYEMVDFCIGGVTGYLHFPLFYSIEIIILYFENWEAMEFVNVIGYINQEFIEGERFMNKSLFSMICWNDIGIVINLEILTSIKYCEGTFSQFLNMNFGYSLEKPMKCTNTLEMGLTEFLLHLCL